ncbi:MAG: ATP-binding protein [Methylomonas sp.]|jgi:two-component system sensor histidine kinase FlrB|uniref:sensor histidine kinase n=1 Tax=Methylomonas sp. TaxID=418 RepID=UPI0025F0D713|nr:ATP-binding protein [Methylomonas sp.]MCK9609161.1 ATP-binding protein [Methylomonas sp.]
MNSSNLQYQQKTERLTDAFRMFNELSENLALSYQGLQEQVAHLNSQLAAARSERLTTLTEKEKLASRLQQILAALPAAVILLDAKNRIIDCNDNAIDFLGEPLLGQQWQDIMTRSLLPVPDSPHERQLLDGRIVSLTRNHLSNDAEQIILLSDVSELRTLQDRLAQQKHLSAMGEMVASLAHQVRTPLATAILYASQMSRPLLSETKRLQFSEKILERLQYLERQVNDMLIYAKQGRLAMQGFSLRGMLQHLAERMEEFDGRFFLDNRVGGDNIEGNQDALRGALLNLLNNAIESGAGVISLKAVQAGQAIEIRIQDDGPGIDTSKQSQLFEPFYTTKTHGTGLGLAVVDSVVKAHKGSIYCRSVLGRGSVFVLSLPILRQDLGLSSAGIELVGQENHYEAV